MNYPRNMIVQYVTERKGGVNRRVGTFVGLKEKGVIRVGWSRCRLPMDTFSEEAGVAFACECILFPKPAPVGRNFSKKYLAFQDRCTRYFKDALPMDVSNRNPTIANNFENDFIFNKDLKTLDRLVDIYFSGLYGKRASKYSHKQKKVPVVPVVPVVKGNVATDSKGTPLPTDEFRFTPSS